MNIYSIILLAVLFLISTLYIYIVRHIQKSQLKFFFLLNIIFLFILCFFVFLGSVLSQKLNISPMYFDYFSYIGSCFLPISLFYTANVFLKTKVKFEKWHFLLFIIPILSLLVLWTNDFHNLFYKHYSIYINETIFGKFFYVYEIYTYALLIADIILLLKYPIKNSGFFSRQSILILIGSVVPIAINILGAIGVVPMTIYITPICFAVTIFFYSIAIFKFDFLSVTPIAMQRVVDRMSDSFIVINEDYLITDLNETFLKTFNLSASDVRNKNFVSFIQNKRLNGIDVNSVNEILEKSKTSTKTFLFKKDFKISDKYFNIEVNGIFSKNIFLGSLILLKDVTQHIIDMKTIKDNQSMLMEKERLASLGQMIGGIAHNLKTPIMSISGATEGLKELTHEYDISIGDPEVTNEDHHEIVKDMDEWIRKIRKYTEYMSDVITAVKGQAVAFSDEAATSFTIKELVKYVDVLMKHELKNALVTLNINVNVPETASIKGNINSLVQVINNMISNAIQAYNGEPDNSIDFTIDLKDNHINFAIQDYGSGIPQSVQDKLFKEMITTKGKNGTGLGLFMSYSNIRAHFNGNIDFESKEGQGTKFIISIPVS